MSLLRIAAIDFLNPAPLMWNFEHPPEAEVLAGRYWIEKMTPAECAARLGSGQADIGLIPIAAYARMPGLAVVPGCTIASLGAIRSILLVLRSPSSSAQFAPDKLVASNEPDPITPAIASALAQVRSVALDTASRTSAMYTRILFRKYWQREPEFLPHPAQLDPMLRAADAALLIGDPALFALEDRAARERRTGQRLAYLDLGQAWRDQTGLPWVSALWAVRQAALADSTLARQVTADLLASRDAGLTHRPALAAEWSARLGLPLATVTAYLTRNIHYMLDEPCLQGIARFYSDARECGLIDHEPKLNFL